MSQLGLLYISPNGLKGHLYFYIDAKEPDGRGGIRFCITVQELYDGSFVQVPIQQYLGFYSPNKDRFTLYPQKKLNESILSFPFQKFPISSSFVYDVSTIKTHLPREQRLAVLSEVSPDQSLDDIFGSV